MSGASPRRRGRQPWNQRVAPYLFVLPNMLIFSVFVIYPALNNFNISRYDSNNGRTFTPVGGENYQRLFSDAEFWTAARNTGVFVFAFVALSTVAAIGVAMLLNQSLRGRAFFRAVVFLPVLLSPVVVGLLWGWILERRGGLLNVVLGAIGIPAQPWLIDAKLAMGGTIFVAVWMHLGFYALIILAGLQGIDSTYHEAAAIDGASASQRFWRVTLPMLRPTALVVVILSMITGFQAFDFIYTLTGGGPVGSTTLMVQYIYEHAFISPIRYGLAAAGGVILFCTIFALTVLNYFYGRRQESI